MKTITLLFAVFIGLLLFYSCTPEEMEMPKPHPVTFENDFANSMMQRDSISKDDESEPPIKPPNKP